MSNWHIHGLWFLSLLCLFFLSSRADATGYEVIDFTEQYSKEVSVSSGGIIVGYHMAGQSNSPNLSRLFIARPKSIDVIKLHLMTMDGFYSAKMKLRFNQSSGIWAVVAIPTKFHQELALYTSEQIVAYAFIEKKHKAKKKIIHQIFPSAWSYPESQWLKQKPIKAQTKIPVDGRFYVNSAESTTSYFSHNKTTFCPNISISVNSVKQTAFNKVCKLTGLNRGNNVVITKTGYNRRYEVWLP